MGTLKAVLWGFLITTALILAGGWAATLLVAPGVDGDYYPATLAAGLLALFYTGASIAIGSYVATQIHDTNETISGLIVAQAFFGFGLIRAFWSEGPSWYTVTAVLLVIPCVILGRSLARRLGSDRMARMV